MFMFDQLKNQNHSVFMDNLYMSATFARHAIKSKNKVTFMDLLELIIEEFQSVFFKQNYKMTKWPKKKET